MQCPECETELVIAKDTFLDMSLHYASPSTGSYVTVTIECKQCNAKVQLAYEYTVIVSAWE